MAVVMFMSFSLSATNAFLVLMVFFLVNSLLQNVSAIHYPMFIKPVN